MNRRGLGQFYCAAILKSIGWLMILGCGVGFIPLVREEIELMLAGNNSIFSLKMLLFSVAATTGFTLIRQSGKLAVGQPDNKIRHVSKAPGSGLLVVVEYLYSPKIVEGVFKPLVTDWRTEYFNALHKQQTWKAHWIRVRYTFSFVKAMGLSKALSFIKSVAHK